jgi:predicted negative regulator of RcsB-dependent stress response
MKTTERHELKHNEVADTLQEAYARIDQNRKAILVGAVVVFVALAGWGGYHYFVTQQQNKAGALLAQALVVVEAPVAPPVAPAADQPAPPMPAGSYPTEQAKLEAALPKLLAAADAYPTTQAGVSARYQAAAALVALGKTSEARQQYEKVVSDGGRGLYARMARLGLAELDVKAGQYDPAIATLRELSLDAKGDLPVDAVLVRLADAYTAAGKKTEAQQALQRVTSEFATSPYAAEAKKQLDALKAGA